MLTDFLRVLTTMMREIKFLISLRWVYRALIIHTRSSSAESRARLRWAAERGAVLPSATIAAAVWATTN